MGEIFILCFRIFCPSFNDLIVPMVIFTTCKNCIARVDGLCEIFVQQKFSAGYGIMTLAYFTCWTIPMTQAKAQQKASERAGIQFALKGATAGNIQREFQMYKQETDAKLDQANMMWVVRKVSSWPLTLWTKFSLTSVWERKRGSTGFSGGSTRERSVTSRYCWRASKLALMMSPRIKSEHNNYSIITDL